MVYEAKDEPGAALGRFKTYGVRTVFNVRLDITEIVPVRAAEGIALFRDGKGDHLQAGIGENLF